MVIRRVDMQRRCNLSGVCVATAFPPAVRDHLVRDRVGGRITVLRVMLNRMIVMPAAPDNRVQQHKQSGE